MGMVFLLFSEHLMPWLFKIPLAWAAPSGVQKSLDHMQVPNALFLTGPQTSGKPRKLPPP